VSNPAPILILDALVVIAAFAWPRSRQKMLVWLLILRYTLVEAPLRAYTGRHHPDDRRIAELERTELS
jgi:hypothetical protein